MESEARQLLQKANPETSRFALLKSTTRGTAGREWILVVEELGWERVQAWKADADRAAPRCIKPAMAPRPTNAYTHAQSMVCATQGASDVPYARGGLVGRAASLLS